MSEIESKIREFVIGRFSMAQRGKLDADQNLLQSGIVDSLGILELVNFLAEEFDIVVADDELIPENFSSVRSLSDFVERKRRPTKA